MAIAQRHRPSRSLLPVLKEGLPDRRGWTQRFGVVALGIAVLMILPLVNDSAHASWISFGMIYVLVGLSINILMGYAGQVSLGHQAFVGVGAFTSALMVSKAHAPFILAVAAAAATGAVAAVALGFVALRLKGLYLALITLAYGQVAERVIFGISSITGGGAGAPAPRPAGFNCLTKAGEGTFDPTKFTCEKSYVYLVYFFVALALFVDWRYIRSKAGRAILAIRDNEIAAASFGIDVVRYKLLAFIYSGIFAGVAGALFAHWNTNIQPKQFDFTLALTFVLMVTVGGLSSRIGIFVGSMFFAIFPLYIAGHQFMMWPFLRPIARALVWVVTLSFVHLKFPITVAAEYVPIIGALLLLLTLTLKPGGIAEQLRPLTEWIRGKPFTLKHDAGGVQSGGAGVRP